LPTRSDYVLIFTVETSEDYTGKGRAPGNTCKVLFCDPVFTKFKSDNEVIYGPTGDPAHHSDEVLEPKARSMEHTFKRGGKSPWVFADRRRGSALAMLQTGSSLREGPLGFRMV
jgi:hypothetical protein